ncbi:MAG TPA: hypothetical protein VNG33_04940, partial [Polyangiaceae bacterium]|nr:hypothetical protein [Polyangiaceae bacterium]
MLARSVLGRAHPARLACSALLALLVANCGSASSNPGTSNAGSPTASGGGGTSSSGGNPEPAAGTATMGGSASGGNASHAGGGSAGSPSGGSGGNAGAAGGTDGGSATGGNGGSGGVAGGPGDCPAGALVCDNFEGYGAPADLAAAWTVTATMATVVVDATKPHAGKNALHITSSGQTPQGAIAKADAPLFPIAGNVYYGRLMLWLTQAPTGGVHWNNVQSAGFMPSSTQWSKYGWGGMFGKILAGYTIRTTPTDMQAAIDCSKPSQMGLPEKQWTCFEWEFDGVANQLHL